jgi:hypothetical protein
MSLFSSNDIAVVVSAVKQEQDELIVRDIIYEYIIKNYNLQIKPFSTTDTIMNSSIYSLSEYDSNVLLKIATSLEVNTIIWTKINKFTEYKFDRLAPATPPYIDLTIYVYDRIADTVYKATGYKQGKLPATIYNKQPSLHEVALPLINKLLSSLDNK